MKYLPLLILLLFSLKLSAQTTVVSGYVSDALTGERIIDAVIFEERSGNHT